MTPSRPPFRPASLETLVRWTLGALESGAPVMGLPRSNFAEPGPEMASSAFGLPLAIPLGAAAGPHTQLAQNIVAAWLCGARFMELKTVQVLDRLDVARPCIDSEDETYNCEWSQELTLDQSFEEYLHAWLLVHSLAPALRMRAPGVVFDMSVGYDLAGIQSGTVRRFLDRMRGRTGEVAAARARLEAAWPAAKEVSIPETISGAVTLSTMHGCPPAEIERIARHLLFEQGVHTWVKLNPTLLGPERLRGLLNAAQGFEIDVPDSAFEHDPKWDDALAMVRRLADAARGHGVTFGIKLSNTLEVRNHRRVFPPAEKSMYLSGRALHPLTLALAHDLTEALDGSVPISFCGGADAFNFADLLADGLSPVTVCTDLLKPGGYARLQQYVANLGEAMEEAGAHTLDEFRLRRAGAGAKDPAAAARANLAAHAARVLPDPRYMRRERRLRAKGARKLGAFDCVAAPCVEACPTHQNIPDYLFQAARGRKAEALDIILRTNPLPVVTGSICVQPCIDACVRNHYDQPLAIREVKRHAATASPGAADRRPGPENGVRVAVIGSGPAGLSAAFYLREAGFAVTLFEGGMLPGGMVGGVVPEYRLPGRSAAVDLARVLDMGAGLRAGVQLGRDLDLLALRREGFGLFVLGVGMQRGKRLGAPGEDAPGVLDGLDFLRRVRRAETPAIGPRVLVVGGGNTAMDAARTARRLVGDGGSVTLVYRRARTAMPADPVEVRACGEEGIGIAEHLAPAEARTTGGRLAGLRCQRMRAGEPDASGRARPEPVPGDTPELECDTLLVAIGQEATLDFLAGEGAEVRRDGTLRVDPETCETGAPGIFACGDVARGPASIIEAIADGRRAAAEIARRHGFRLQGEPGLDKGISPDVLLSRRGTRLPRGPLPELPPARRRGFDEVLLPLNDTEARAEAARCLDCDEICSLCVTVCPNRALLSYTMEPLELDLPRWTVRGGRAVEEGPARVAVLQRTQIVRVADFCNECGNCVPFCPTSGEPWREKPAFHLSDAGFEAGEEGACRLRNAEAGSRIEARLGGGIHRLTWDAAGATYEGPRATARWQAGPWKLLSAIPAGGLPDGTSIDLEPCVKLLALTSAAAVLPPA